MSPHTAFEVLRTANRPDWQRAEPTSEEERRWYHVGYELKDDYQINEPVSALVPAAFRFWWVLGLTDAKAGTPPRAEWTRNSTEPKSSTAWGPLLFGAAAGITGLGLLLASSLRRKVGT
jgi:hypothetical protein